MPYEYEALVGHLYVVGGRSITVNPPGALVEVAPLRAARGREADTFFALALPSGDALAPAAFYERMAQTAAEQYFDSTGSVTAALREVFTYLNQNLADFNRSRKESAYETSLICAVLRGEDLILARTGSGVAALRYQGRVETLPPDLNNDEALFGAPLGVRPLPDLKLSRHKVATGSRLILTDANFADFTPDQIREALAADDIGMLLVRFKELARLHLSLLAVEFVPPEVPSPPTAREGASSLEIAEAARAEAARKRSTETAAQVRPPRRRNPLGKTGERIAQQGQQGLGTAAGGIASGLSLLTRTIEHYFGPVEEGKKRWYTLPVATGVAIVLPVVIVAAVVLLWVSSSGQSAFEQCIDQALTLADLARSDPNASPGNRRVLWTTAMEQAADCEPLRPEDPLVAGLITEGQTVIDRLDDIDRREAIRMDSRPGALFDRVVLAGRDMYLLDKTNGLVYQGIVSEDGLGFSRAPSPLPDVQEGRTVSGFPISEIIDIAYSAVDEAIFVLDAEGVLVECDRRRTEACEANRLLDAERWEKPLAMTFWGTEPRLYILDPGANQIWRYDRAGGGFIAGAREYFDGQNATAASITAGVDFAITDQGVVYVLLADGIMLRYDSGRRIDFQYGDFIQGQELTSAQGMFLDTNPIAQSIYIVSRSNRTIYEIGYGGTRRSSFRVTDESLFSALSGVTATGLEMIYAISGNSVFALQKSAP